ncbi:MAG: gliding motility protein GldL [Bacteroidaceae bacterium]|nr:gliding motility protein GldL [Bacteroidaceae bacterium]
MAKKNIAVRLQNWMDSVAGQTFLNYAYSWGAAVVILGALFKLTHLKGADLALFLGMGTEVVVFFLSAFDRPFDKSEDGKELPEDAPIFVDDEDETTEETEHVAVAQPVVQTIYQPVGQPVVNSGSASYAAQPAEQPVVQPVVNGGAAAQPVAGVQVQAGAVQPVASPEMTEATQRYLDQIEQLTDVLGKVAEQSSRLTRDSEEMTNLNRTLTGITSVYELHLRAVSGQLGSIDEINEQIKKLARQIDELNKVYARMLNAMTVNMPQGGAMPNNPTL